ncbi:MAG: hypothetical protein GY915_05010 [bacterium]|nr:hypothetical protein [bacterium]
MSEEVKEKKKRASKTLLLGYPGCGLFLIGAFLIMVGVILGDGSDGRNGSGVALTFFLIGVLICYFAALLQLLIWVVKFFMRGTQGKLIK